MKIACIILNENLRKFIEKTYEDHTLVFLPNGIYNSELVNYHYVIGIEDPLEVHIFSVPYIQIKILKCLDNVILTQANYKSYIKIYPAKIIRMVFKD